jgi:hypothetical protein
MPEIKLPPVEPGKEPYNHFNDLLNISAQNKKRLVIIKSRWYGRSFLHELDQYKQLRDNLMANKKLERIRIKGDFPGEVGRLYAVPHVDDDFIKEYYKANLKNHKIKPMLSKDFYYDWILPLVLIGLFIGFVVFCIYFW